MSSKNRFALALGLVTSMMGAQAAPVIYFGENQSPAQTVTGAPLTAHNNFPSGLTGVGTETFDGLPSLAGAPVNLLFPGSAGDIGAQLTGVGQVFPTPSSSGRFNTTGATAGPQAGKWWSVEGTFEVTFSKEISAFGFYGTDIGDFNGQVTITLTDTGGGTTDFTVPNTVNGNDGSLLFWGFIDSAKSYTKVTFGNTAAGVDFFGFDDMVVGDIGQVTPPVVPEPATLALVGISLLGVFAARRRS